MASRCTKGKNSKSLQWSIRPYRFCSTVISLIPSLSTLHLVITLWPTCLLAVSQNCQAITYQVKAFVLAVASNWNAFLLKKSLVLWLSLGLYKCDLISKAFLTTTYNIVCQWTLEFHTILLSLIFLHSTYCHLMYCTFVYCWFLSYKVYEARDFVYLFWSQYVEWCLPCNRYSINICWIDY